MAEYIEKKKLVNSLKMWLMDLENDMNKGDYGELCENKGAREAVESCICEVEEQPAAGVQPVKRGRWIKAQDKQGDYFLCSNCGTAEKTESGQDGAVWWHDEYCRKCGARMDGEQND